MFAHFRLATARKPSTPVQTRQILLANTPPDAPNAQKCSKKRTHLENTKEKPRTSDATGDETSLPYTPRVTLKTQLLY